MEERDPALFYFWAHGGSRNYDPMEELDTPTLHDLVDRADAVFLEFISSSLDGTGELEKDINEYVRTKEMPFKLRDAYDYQMRLEGKTTAEFFIADLLKGTSKRIVLEKTLAAPFDYNEESNMADMVFFAGSLEMAREARRRFLEVAEEYQGRRDRDVTEQIYAVPETVLVLFGAGHLEIEKRVAAKRPTEVHFPFYDYPVQFDTQLRIKYRETGELDEELFLRKYAEDMSRKGVGTRFGKSISSRETDLLAHHYASIFTPDQIIGLKDYFVSCRRMLYGISQDDIFDSYLKKEGITPVEEVLAGLRP